MSNNKGIMREYFERKVIDKIFQQQAGRHEARKKLKSENQKCRKKDVRFKFTEEERNLNKQFAAELEIKSKLDKKSEAKIAETLKKLKTKRIF